MRRRDFITLLGGAAAVQPLSSRAQPAVPVIGFLHSGSPEPNAARVAGFRKGLRESGFVEDQNVGIEFCWAAGRFDRLPELAADLVRQKVAVIATLADTSAAIVAKAATTTIPIVFAIGGDPVATGLVASLNRPGGNITGISILQVELTQKRLGLLRDLVPGASHFHAIINPLNAIGAAVPQQVKIGAEALGIDVDIVRASADTELEAAFAEIAKQPGSVVLIATDAFFFIRRAKIAALAALQTAGVLRQSRLCGRRRFDQLWPRRGARVRTGRQLCRPGPQWREARRSAGRTISQVRNHHQQQDRQGARARSSVEAVVHRRRSARMSAAYELPGLVPRHRP
jgi:putative ABC transport system substrate-binding protein